MNLTRYEQEVVINLNAEEDVATIYSSNPVWLRKMESLASEFPDVFLLIRQSGISKTYSFPKRLLRMQHPSNCILHIVCGVEITWKNHFQKKALLQK